VSDENEYFSPALVTICSLSALLEPGLTLSQDVLPADPSDSKEQSLAHPATFNTYSALHPSQHNCLAYMPASFSCLRSFQLLQCPGMSSPLPCPKSLDLLHILQQGSNMMATSLEREPALSRLWGCTSACGQAGEVCKLCVSLPSALPVLACAPQLPRPCTNTPLQAMLTPTTATIISKFKQSQDSQ
jgi:hypothetical protein